MVENRMILIREKKIQNWRCAGAFYLLVYTGSSQYVSNIKYSEILRIFSFFLAKP